MEKYLSRRKGYIAKERALRHDHAFRQRLTPTEQKACQIVRAIREQEIQSVWRDPLNLEIFPGMSFPLAREKIESTKLWRIVRKLPKGALLHGHYDGLVDMKWLMETVVATPGICMKSDIPLSRPESISTSLIEFQYLADPVPASQCSILSADYSPNSFVSLARTVEEFPEGPDAFVKHLVSRVTLPTEEAMNVHKGVNAAWRKFESVYPILRGATFYEPIMRQFLHRLFAELLADGVQWIDNRVVPFGGIQLASGEHGLPIDLVRIFQEEVLAFRATPTGSSFWGGRIIWTSIRSMSKEILEADMRDCLAAKRAYPDTIAGYDLVSQEDLGHTLLEHLPSLLWFREQCESEGLNIPFFFHAGEVLGDGDPHDMNVLDAILLGTKRIGHGYSLFKHPLLIEEVKQRDICVEVCPISNEVLRLNHSVTAHPLPALLANGVAVSISCDGSGIFNAGSGVSYDFWQVLKAFENVGLEGLGDMAETSIWYAPFHDGEGYDEEIGFDRGEKDGVRQRRIAEWRENWQEFCEWVVVEFGK